MSSTSRTTDGTSMKNNASSHNCSRNSRRKNGFSGLLRALFVSLINTFLILALISGCGGGGGEGTYDGPAKGPYVPEFCGDNIIQTGEACDDGNLQSGDGCNSTCRREGNQISAAYGHTCAITSNGGVKCWGSNSYGQLGDGSTSDSVIPVDVVGLSSGVAQVSAGYKHTCALTAEGAVKCWGSNSYGQLGDGTRSSSYTPVTVADITIGIIQVSAGDWHTCALTKVGSVLCWGGSTSKTYPSISFNKASKIDSLTPVAIPGLRGIAQISAGPGHTCVVTDNGGVKCWGRGDSGELGDGTTNNSDDPVDVVGLGSGVAQVFAGEGYSCALTKEGQVFCWGRDSYGQENSETETISLTPVNVVGIAKGVRIDGGLGHVCAISASSEVMCWGNNQDGQVGDGTNVSTQGAVSVTGSFSGFAEIALGSDYSCALSLWGDVKCWGNNYNGQLGNGKQAKRMSPVDILDNSFETKAVSAGWTHTCALTSSGGVKCWGSTPLGDGTNEASWMPVDVQGLTQGVSQISSGDKHVCALMNSGGVKCWGSGSGSLGDGTKNSSDVPVDVSGIDDAIQVSAGRRHTCAVLSSGGAKCWGYNYSGQLGDGTQEDRLIPTDVSGLSAGVKSIKAGGYHTCALMTSGKVKCWGINYLGQLGDNTNNRSSLPVDVVEISGVKSLSVGTYISCGLMNDNTLKCWGDSRHQERIMSILTGVGGTDVGHASPESISGLDGGISEIYAGGAHSCAKIESGSFKCWGYNSYGEMSESSFYHDSAAVDAPVEVDVKSIAVGIFHTCVVSSSGKIKCWGNNSSYALGVPRGSLTPVDVVGF